MVGPFVFDFPDGFDHVNPAVPKDTFPFLIEDSSEINDASFDTGLFHEFPNNRILRCFAGFDSACGELHHRAFVFSWMIEEEYLGTARAIT